jgi:DNA-binding response OmpR family regulator
LLIWHFQVTVPLIEDNDGLAAGAAQALTEARLRLDWRWDFESAYDLAIDLWTDLFITNRTLPDGDGVDFLHQLRNAYFTTLVLMISARSTIGDRVTALDGAADDYLVKPFAFDEFVARCRALMRRPCTFEGEPIRYGARVLRPDSYELTVGGNPIGMSRRECQVQVALLRRRGRACTRPYLEAGLYDPRIAVSPNTLDTCVSRLRSLVAGVKANVDLKTVRGVAYALVEKTRP